MLAPPGEKFCLLQIDAWCNLYYFTCIKSDIITFHSHNSIIFNWSYDYDTFQPKFGQCELLRHAEQGCFDHGELSRQSHFLFITKSNHQLIYITVSGVTTGMGTWGLVSTKFWQPPEPYFNQGGQIMPAIYCFLHQVLKATGTPVVYRIFLWWWFDRVIVFTWTRHYSSKCFFLSTSEWVYETLLSVNEAIRQHENETRSKKWFWIV